MVLEKGDQVKRRLSGSGRSLCRAPPPCDLTLVLCLGLRPSFHRASLSDTMALWESLQQQGELQLLQTAEKKFTIEPFKAKSPKDVEDLDSLVQTQR